MPPRSTGSKHIPDNIPLLRKSTRTLQVPAHLDLDPEERGLLLEWLELVGEDCYRFAHTLEDQDQACQILARLDLHIPDSIDRDARSKLVIQHSDNNSIGKNKMYKRWTRLYQCQAGIDSTAGLHTSKRRLRPWENIKCCMYARVITTHDEQDPRNKKLLIIDEISGHLDHSEECQAQLVMSRNPRIPIHPELRSFAISLLQDGVPIIQVRLRCRTFGKDRWGSKIGDEQFRYVLVEYDTISLYRTLRQGQGIPRTERMKALDNIDCWFREDNPQPPLGSESISSACLYYQPLGPGNNDRLILIFSTPRQKEMAWMYGHQKQVLMDGTFGVCASCILVFFLMAIDDRNIGIPIATIIFTPKKDAKAGHASYDKAILDDVLSKWKKAMGSRNGQEFTISIGSTDNDKRERYALQQNWPDIDLILCMFHTWQSWRNKLNSSLKAIPKGPHREEVRNDLASFLMRLLKELTNYKDAIEAYNSKLDYFRGLALPPSTELNQKKSKAALVFLAYFGDYLRLQSFWRSWSRAGAIAAAEKLDVPEQSIARTTNHLESFNGRIKRKYFQAYTHSQRLPRIDVWILLFNTKALADFFNEYDERRSTIMYYEQMRHVAPSSVPFRPPSTTSASALIPASLPTADEVTAELLMKMQVDIEEDTHSDRSFSDSDELSSDCDDSEDTTHHNHPRGSFLAAGANNEEDSMVMRDRVFLQINESGERSSLMDLANINQVRHGGLEDHVPGDDCQHGTASDNLDREFGDWLWGHNGDIALCSDDILVDLPSDMSSESEVPDSCDGSFEFSSSAGTDHGVLEPVHLDPDTQDPQQTSTFEPMAWQELLEAEDQYIRTLRNLLLISPHQHQMISDRISQRLRFTFIGSDYKEFQPDLQPELPEAALQATRPILHSNRPPQLLPQRKEQRKESHGTR